MNDVTAMLQISATLDGVPCTNVSAVILSADPARVARSIPGVQVVGHVSCFHDAAGLLQARLDAIKRVRTPWFFFLDDDDDLPHDYLRVLDLCTSAGTPLAYTDEIVTNDDGTQRVRKSAPYSEEAFIRTFTLVHHLAVCRTDAAWRAARYIPRGTYGFENLLFFQVAKGGATYISEVGYIWHRRASGLNRHPTLLTGLMQSALWAKRSRST